MKGWLAKSASDQNGGPIGGRAGLGEGPCVGWGGGGASGAGPVRRRGHRLFASWPYSGSGLGGQSGIELSGRGDFSWLAGWPYPSDWPVS